MELRFEVQLKPVPASRPRVSQFGSGVGYTKTYTAFRKAAPLALLVALRDAGIERDLLPLEGVLEAEYVFHCEQPKRPSHPYPRGDVDNYVKAIQDALESGGLFKNDTQLIKITAEKQYAPKGKPGWIEVTLRSLSL